jgi:hypothetical protein
MWRLARSSSERVAGRASRKRASSARWRSRMRARSRPPCAVISASTSPGHMPSRSAQPNSARLDPLSWLPTSDILSQALGAVARAVKPSSIATTPRIWVSSMPAAVQRRAISPDDQRFTLRWVWRTISIIDSHGLVDSTDRLAQRVGAVDHEQDPLLGVEATLDQVGEQRGRHGRVLGRCLPRARAGS